MRATLSSMRSVSGGRASLARATTSPSAFSHFLPPEYTETGELTRVQNANSQQRLLLVRGSELAPLVVLPQAHRGPEHVHDQQRRPGRDRRSDDQVRVDGRGARRARLCPGQLIDGVLYDGPLGDVQLDDGEPRRFGFFLPVFSLEWLADSRCRNAPSLPSAVFATLTAVVRFSSVTRSTRRARSSGEFSALHRSLSSEVESDSKC